LLIFWDAALCLTPSRTQGAMPRDSQWLGMIGVSISAFESLSRIAFCAVIRHSFD
jgi:hypothetical protein